MSTVIHNPCIITPRLMPGLRIADAFISIGYAGTSDEDRTIYDIWIDIDGKEPYNDQTLKSGVGGGTLQEGLESLLSFLGAAAESFAYGMRSKTKGENEDLFPRYVVEWAYLHDDEIAVLGYELSEGKRTLIEE